MIGKQSVGKLIRAYRRRGNLSQLELEAEINAGFGSISKIERDLIDPSKETINKIVNALHLNTHEAALLYSLDISEYDRIFSAVNKIHSCQTLVETLQATIDELVSNLKIYGCAILVMEGNNLVLRAMSQDKLTSQITAVTGFKVEGQTYPLDAEYSNGILEAARTRELVLVDTLAEAIMPVLGKRACDFIQKLGQIKALGNMPIITNGKLQGVIIFNFSGEERIQERISVIKGFCETVGFAMQKFKIQ